VETVSICSTALYQWFMQGGKLPAISDHVLRLLHSQAQNTGLWT